MLLDPGSFCEVGLFVTHRASSFGMDRSHPAGDGVVTGTGRVDGRQVCVFGQDFTVLRRVRRGPWPEDRPHHRARPPHRRTAHRPHMTGGARIQEGSTHWRRMVRSSIRTSGPPGVIPQISVILGPCAGGAVYSPAVTDFIVMVAETAHMFITGPEVIRAVTHEDVSFEELGGAVVHSEVSGVAHFAAGDEEAAVAQVRWLLSYLPQNNLDAPPHVASGDDPGRETSDLLRIVGDDPQQPYDVRAVIEVLVDDGEFLEVQGDYARNIVVGFVRLDGQSVGIVANQPEVLAGVIDINASSKAARFIRFCDAFHIPVVTLVDTPGFLPGCRSGAGWDHPSRGQASLRLC